MLANLFQGVVPLALLWLAIPVTALPVDSQASTGSSAPTFLSQKLDTFGSAKANAALDASTGAADSKHLAHRFEHIVAFGDSLIDNGNGTFLLSHRTWPADPAYFNGRFSNGPVWVEYLSTALTGGPSALEDIAFGGATTNNSNVQGYTKNNTLPVPSIVDQVHGYINNPKKRIDIPKTLVVFSGGGNDAFFTALHNKSLVVAAREAAKTLLNEVHSLYHNEGYSNFLIPKSFALSKTPFALSLSPLVRVRFIAFETAFDVAFNESVKASKEISSGKIHLTTISGKKDVQAFSDRFKETTKPCYNGMYGPGPKTKTKGSVCSNPDDYLYWDEVHPTTKAHSYIAQDAVEALKATYGHL